MTLIPKNRSLSNEDFLKELQKEYFSAYVRSRISPSVREKAFQRELMRKKEEKILDLSKRKSLVSIFDSEMEYEKEKLVTIPLKGYPNLKYKTEEEKNRLELTDRINYYSKGAPVLFGDREIRRGNIFSFDLISETVTINTAEKKYKDFPIESVTRIL